MNYKYNELDYAKLIYDSGFQTKHIATELRLLAIYMRRNLDYKPKELREEMYKFCKNNIPEYNKAKHYKIINKAINQACKKGSILVKIDKINIYDYELEYIESLNICDGNGEISSYAYECKKVIFTLLCQMKLNKIITKTRNNEESKGLYFKGGNRKYNNLKKIAKIPEKLKINDDIIYTLGQSNIITIMFNGLIKLNFMEDINEITKNNEERNVVIEISDFDTVGWYYDYHNGINKIKLCKECNQPFRQTKHDILYCNKHKDYYQPIGTKIITCIDCGEEIVVDGIVKKQERCTDCYKVYRNNYQKELMKKRRNKAK